MNEVPNKKILSWETSATGDWSEESGLLLLRDMPVDELALILWDNGICVENSALLELMAHMNFVRAAELARALFAINPVAQSSISISFGEGYTNFLLNAPLELIQGVQDKIIADLVETTL